MREQPTARSTGARPLIVPVVLLFSLVLIGAPALLGSTQGSPVVFLLTFTPFLAAIGVLLARPLRWRVNVWILVALAYVGLIVIAALRGLYFEALSRNFTLREIVQIGLLSTLSMFAFLREPSDRHRERYLRALCWSPVVYVGVNVVLYYAGVAAPQSYKSDVLQVSATTLQSFGISLNRVQFPLASGVNSFGPICAIAFATSTTLALRGQQRTLAIVGSLTSLFAILAIDSRGALLFGLLAIGLVHFMPRARKRGFGPIALALPVLPLVLITTIGALSSTTGSLSRDRAADIATGTGRTFVWGAVIDTLTEPRLENLVGYGQNGQLTSGASVSYAYLFPGLVDPLLAPAHNMLLQTGLDLGWIGVPMVIVIAGVMLTRYGRRSPDPLYLALLAATLAMLGEGLVEVAGTTEGPESFAWWILAIFPAMRAMDKGTVRVSGLEGGAGDVSGVASQPPRALLLSNRAI